MADPAQVRCVNNALFQLNKPQVADLSEQSLRANAAATKIMAVLQDAYEAVLGRHGWLDALAYACLSPAVIAGDVNWKYSSVYRLPAGALHVWQVRAGPVPADLQTIDWLYFDCLGPLLDRGVAWEVGSIDTDQGAMRVLRANTCETIPVSYVRSCSYTAMSQHLRDAVSWEAAARAANVVLGDGGQAKQIKEDAEAMIVTAISVESTQEGGQPAVAGSVIGAIRRWGSW